MDDKCVTEEIPMTLDLTTLEASLKRDEELAAKATEEPWYTVGDPWLPSGQASYVIAGHYDPHVGTPICDALEPDGFEGEDDADLERQEQEARAQSDANMAFIAHARTALLARVKDCRTLSAEIVEMRSEIGERTRDHQELWRVHLRTLASLAEAVRALEATDANVERVAAAMFDNRPFQTEKSPRWDKAHADAKDIFRIHARAALSSLQPRKDTP